MELGKRKWHGRNDATLSLRQNAIILIDMYYQVQMYQVCLNQISINWNWHGIHDTEFDNQTKIPCHHIDMELGKRKCYGRNDVTLSLTKNAIKKTHIYRHGISNLPSSFDTNYWGEGIKIQKNPYMGTLREVVGRCPCGDDIFVWKLQPTLIVLGFLLKILRTKFLKFNYFFEN